MEPHISLQGSIKRKLEDDSSPATNVASEGIFPSDSKRLCLDDVTLSMDQPQGTHSSWPDMQNSHFFTNRPHYSSISVANHLSTGGIGSPFAAASSAEIKQGLVGVPNSMANNTQTMDQELQDLLEELTKMPDPSPTDLEKILGNKTDEALNVSHTPQSINSTPKPSPQVTPHLETHIPSKDFSPGFKETTELAQMTPSVGAPYSIPPSTKPVPSPMSSTSQNPSQSSLLPATSSRPGPNWHAQQLKQLAIAANKQVASQQQQMQTPGWQGISSSGPSPPYRPEKLTGSSPHHQPFSPQNTMVSSMTPNNIPVSNIQSPQNPMLSNMPSTSNPSSRPSPPCRPEKLSSPALNQQPFSPQSSMLPSMASTSISASSIKTPQNTMVSNIVSNNTGPSPPYRPEKLSSPALHQQPFSAQNTIVSSIASTSNPTNMQNSLYQSLATSQSSNISMIIQQQQQQQKPSSGLQSIVKENSVAQDQFSFTNTKPLSHFEIDQSNQKMSSVSGAPGQPSLAPYIEQHNQTKNLPFIPQQLRQLMQQPRMQRSMQPVGLVPQNRPDQNPGMVPRHRDPSSIQTAGSGCAPPNVNGYTRNDMLKQQIIRKQLLQNNWSFKNQDNLKEKQRQSMMGITSEQRAAFSAQQINPFQGVAQSLSTDCSQSMQSPPHNHRLIPANPGLLQSSLGPGIAPGAIHQNNGAMGIIANNPAKQPGIFSAPSDFNIAIRSSQNPLGISSGCQTVHSQSAVHSGMTVCGLNSSSLTNPVTTLQTLRPSSVSQIASIYTASPSQMWTTQGISRMPTQSQIDTNMQHFPNNSLYSKQYIRPGLPNQQFPHQNVVPPNQIAPGVQIRQMQKLNPVQSGQDIVTLNNQPFRNNLARGPLSAMAGMKPTPPGVTSLSPSNPSPGLVPPSYPSTGQLSGGFKGPNSGSDLPSYDFFQSSNSLPGQGNEADFLESLIKSNEWSN
uniref:Mastermind like domain containing 1 n=1 Tax=Latimeria chalumnae TaxID=7897 RepID=H3B0J3_LATCH